MCRGFRFRGEAQAGFMHVRSSSAELQVSERQRKSAANHKSLQSQAQDRRHSPTAAAKTRGCKAMRICRFGRPLGSMGLFRYSQIPCDSTKLAVSPERRSSMRGEKYRCLVAGCVSAERETRAQRIILEASLHLRTRAHQIQSNRRTGERTCRSSKPGRRVHGKSTGKDRNRGSYSYW